MTSTRRTFRLAAAALGALAALAPLRPAAAQSLLASRGLGYTLDPFDARARAMGGIGLGLPGRNLSLVNPAEDAGLPVPTLTVAFQPDAYSGTADGFGTNGHTQRFPVIHAVFPVHRVAVSVGYGSFLDQHWQTRVVDSAVVAGEMREVNDRFSSNGGVARLRTGASYHVNDRLFVGAGVDLFTGSVHDSTIHAVSGLNQTLFQSTFRYSGVGYVAGARFSPIDPVAVSASVTTATKLHGRPDGDSLATGKDYDLPLTVDAGASGRIGGNTTLALSGRWARWSTANDELAATGGARDTRGAAAGLEFEGFRLGSRVVPLRLGAHYTELPFRWSSGGAARDFPAERGVSGGLGFRLAGGGALADAAVERGKRGGSGAGFDESYWRFSFSLTLLGR
jgi:hypothetical protein